MQKMQKIYAFFSTFSQTIKYKVWWVFSKLGYLVPNQNVLMKIEMKLLRTFPFFNDGSVSAVHYLLSWYHTIMHKKVVNNEWKNCME